MSDHLFFAEFSGLSSGDELRITGEEAHHGFVRRSEPGEPVVIADGTGVGVKAEVVLSSKEQLIVRIGEPLPAWEPALQVSVAQALAKGERSELAVQMAVELGAWRILAWQAERSIVRWQGARGEKALGKWRASARQATKQSRRLRIPDVEAVTTKDLAHHIAEHDASLVLHEQATRPLAGIDLPIAGRVLVIVGPEGGISPDELHAFNQAGAEQVLLTDGVLRTSTAGAAALAQIQALVDRRAL